MKGFGRKRPALPVKRTTGIAISDDRVVAVTFAWSPLGPRRTGRAEEPVDPLRGVEGALDRLAGRGLLRGTVVAGLPLRRSLLRSVRIPAEEDRTTKEILTEVVTISYRTDENVVVDSVATRLSGARIVTVSVCHRDLADEVNRGLGNLAPGHRRLLSEAAAIHRLAVGRAGGLAHGKTTLRLLRWDKEGLLLLGRGPTLFASRIFPLEGTGAEETATSAVRALVTHAVEGLELPKPGTLVVHGEPFPEEIETAVAAAAETEITRGREVPTDEEGKARALGLEGFRAAGEAPNLLHSLLPPPSVASLFPIRAAAVVLLAVIAVGWTLNDKVNRVENRRDLLVRASEQDAKELGLAPKKVAKARKDLDKQVSALHTFLSCRVEWGPVLRSLTSHLPARLLVTMLDGSEGVSPYKKKAPKPVFAISALYPRPDTEEAPELVPLIVAGLSGSKKITKEFPRIDGADVSRKGGNLNFRLVLHR